MPEAKAEVELAVVMPIYNEEANIAHVVAEWAAALDALGIPYVLPIGMWGLAAGTAFTLYQRMRAVYVDAKAKSANSAAPPAQAAQPATAQSEEA